MNANITVLKDESLGGVEREYHEVKRKASVGERIKIVDASSFSDYGNGDTFIVERDDCDGDIFITDNVGDEEGVFDYEYVTLEPSDIVRINSARFRMVDRKAAVGERVIIVNTVDLNGDGYENGNVFDVTELWEAGVDVDHSVTLYHREYHVLEPVKSTPISEPLSAKPAPDQAAEIIAKLSTRVTALEERVAALETAPINPRLSDVGVRAQEATDAFARATKRTSATVAEVTANLAQRAKEARQRKRDDIVKRAKEDLHALSIETGNYVVKDSPTCRGNICEVEFIVNRDKRKVTAILRGVNSRKVRAVGRAVCNPDDVFNVHLGRAISLRKALKQPIPEEYVNAPQPTEVRVGDVVKWTYKYGGEITEVVTITRIDGDQYRFSDGCWDDRDTLTVLDDSRTDSAEPRKEVA